MSAPTVIVSGMIAATPRQRSRNARHAETPAAAALTPSGQPSLGVLVCLGAAATCSAAVLLTLQSHLTFIDDEWKFLLQRRGFSAGAFLDPNNDHIAVALAAVYKALLAAFGMTSAFPFAVLSTLVFLMSVVLLFVYLFRRVGEWAALLGSVLVLFLGAGWNDLLWAFQVGFSASIAAGIGAFLALDRDDRKGDLVACALLAVSTSFSELGIPFVIGALVSVALGPSPRLRRLYVGLVPLALYGIWYLGWGHKGPHWESFHNLVHSPKFVFDSISQNLASLFGLATPLSGNGEFLVGLNWGRILLAVAIVLAVWRLLRVRLPLRWPSTVLAAGGAFWFLTALNAIPLLRTPTTGRYQYPGAIFVLLIAAELLRGVRVDKRLLAAAAAVTIAAAVSGLIFLHDGYRLYKYLSDDTRARLAAVEIARGHESPDLVIYFHVGAPPGVDAHAYFSALDAFGSPAFSESQLLASDEAHRAAADQQLAQAEAIKLGSVPSGADQGARRCTQLPASSPGQPVARLGPGRVTLETAGPSVQGAAAPVELLLGRFSDGLPFALGKLHRGAPQSLVIPADRSVRPWRLGFTGVGSPVILCRMSAKRS
jgi:hypothetical protein